MTKRESVSLDASCNEIVDNLTDEGGSKMDDNHKSDPCPGPDPIEARGNPYSDLPFEDIVTDHYIQGAHCKPGQVVAVGKLLEIGKGGKFDSTVYTVETVDGVKKIFGTADLNKQMARVKEGQTVKIVFLEKQTLPEYDNPIYRWKVSVSKKS